MSISKNMDSLNICRLCLCTNSTCHLYKSQESVDRQLLFKLKKCIPVHIKENDALPKEFCGNCIAKIEEFNEFINQCVSTESILNSFCKSSSVSDQSKFQGQLLKGKSLGGGCNDNFGSPKKNDSLNSSLSMLTLDSMSTRVQSSLIQMVNYIDRHQDVCKYDAQPLTKATNEDKSNKYNHTVVNNSIQQIKTDLSKDKNNSSNVKIITLDIPSLDEKDAEINMNSANNMIVQPEIINSQFTKSDNDQHSELNDSISEVSDNSKYMNKIVSTNGVSTSSSVCEKSLESEDEIGMHIHDSEAINNTIVHNLPTSTTMHMMEPTTFSCNVCKKTFKRKDHLIRHLRIHIDKRPLRCKTCTTSVNQKKYLIKHILIHKNQKLYECDICRIHYRKKSCFLKHKIKNSVNGSFVCQTCGKSFTIKWNYNMHMETHNDIEEI